MHRRDFMKITGLTLAAQAIPQVRAEAGVEKPNIILIIADQRRYGLSKVTGYPLDTSPTLDRLQTSGIGFRNNYCTTPVCVPSRISMLTGRWPEAHRVRMNLQAKEAYFSQDIYQVAKQCGYRTALIGKNHTYLTKADTDVWREYSHEGGYIPPDAPPDAPPNAPAPALCTYDHVATRGAIPHGPRRSSCFASTVSRSLRASSETIALSITRASS